jgi:hypothetical protein
MKETLDFIVIGAQKAGTTSLFEYIRRHPQLSLPVTKEAPFFSSEAARSRGWQDYLRKGFSLADPACKWGTVTPQYMVGGVLDREEPCDERTVPSRIHELAPSVRLIAILRDPVERARSHHRMAYMEGLEKRTFDEAVDELLLPDALAEARRRPEETTGYVAWGEYGRILSGYLDVFPREQLLVLFTDDLEREPELLLRKMFEFLNVQDDFRPDNLGMRYRAGGTKRRLSLLGTYSFLSPLALQRALTRSSTAKGLWHALPESRRRRIDAGFGRLVYHLDLWNRRGGVQEPEMPADSTTDATVERLRDHFALDGATLATRLSVSPPWLPFAGVAT